MSEVTLIENALLAELYQLAFSSQKLVLRDLHSERGWPSQTFEQAVHRLDSRGAMEILTIGRMVDVTVPGMLEAENTVLAGSPFVLENAELHHVPVHGGGPVDPRRVPIRPIRHRRVPSARRPSRPAQQT